MASEKDPPDPSKKLPIAIDSWTLPNGDPVFKVQTAFSFDFAATYSYDHVLNTLHKWIVEFFMAVGRGDSLKNTPFEKFKVKIRSKEAEKSDEEAWDTMLYYTKRASLIFKRALPLRLADIPEQFFTEVFISVIQEMEDGEVFSIAGNRADVWNYYTSILSGTLKRNWNTTLPKGSKFWTPDKRARLLKYYNFAIEPMQEWWKKYHGSAKARRRKPTDEEKKEAQNKHPDLFPYFSQLSKAAPPHHLALQYVSDVTGFKGYESMRAQISKARKEAKQSQK
jgi:hypothetical protein